MSWIRNTGSEIDNCQIREGGGGGFGKAYTSVVNPRCFPGSRFLFPIPDLGSKISDPRATKKRRKNSFQFAYFFCHHTKLSEHTGWIRDPRSWIQKKTYPGSGIRGQQSTGSGSATLFSSYFFASGPLCRLTWFASSWRGQMRKLRRIS